MSLNKPDCVSESDELLFDCIVRLVNCAIQATKLFGTSAIANEAEVVAWRVLAGAMGYRKHSDRHDVGEWLHSRTS